MTDRVNSFIVVLEHDMRIDDIADVTNALSMVKNVIRVEPHVVDTADFAASYRVKKDIADKLVDLAKDLYGIKNDKA